MPARRKTTKTKKQPASHHIGHDVAGLMLIALGIFALISVFFTGLTGAFGEAVKDVLFGFFGVMAYIMPLFAIVAGWLVMISWQIRIHKGKFGSVTALFLLFISLIHLFYDSSIRLSVETVPGYGAYLALVFRYGVEKGGGAGILGGLLAWPLNHFLGRAGAFIFVIAGLIGCVALLTRFSLGGAGRRVTEAAYAATASAIGQARERRKASVEDNIEHEESSDRVKERKAPEPEPSEIPSYIFDNRERPLEPPFAHDSYEPQLEIPQGRKDADKNVRYIDERLSMPRRKLPNEQIRTMKGSRRRPEPDIIDLSTGQKVSIHSIRAELNEPPQVTPFPMEPMEDNASDNISAFYQGGTYFQVPRGVPLKDEEERTRECADMDLESGINPEEWDVPTANDEWNTRNMEDWNSPVDHLPDDLNAYDEVTLDEMGLPIHEEIEEEGITIPEELPDVDEFDPEPDLDLPMPIDEPVLAAPARRSSIDNAFGNPIGRSGNISAANRVDQHADNASQPLPPPPPPLYKRPQLDLLSRPVNTEAAEIRARSEQEERANLLLTTLKSFGINATIVGISRGPSLTRYELKPAAGIKVSRIVSLSDDIAMNMAAAGVRIEAPIPGKAAIGIEVPNLETFPVALREVLTAEEFQGHKSRLAIAFGMDITGKPVVGDLADMPHLLIAGATGSGKSVCINSLVTSILYKSSPEEVKLIMIDPKVVELSVYNGIPHLLIPVVTDPKKAAGALNWAVQEMESRYKKFAATNSRDLKGYNAYAKANGMETIYQLVVIVDELADLMIVASREVEEHINRLAQLARAAGIHLVIATQRPSVNVITGVIKANIPSRIAFAVASQVDSRTILDMAGAEKLLGRGDMLFHPRGASKPRRVQGCLITDAEVHRVVDVVKRTNGEVLYNPEVIETLERMDAPAAEQSRQDDDDGDDLLRQAIELALDAGQVSASMLQRRYRIGYARAGRLIDEMEQRGIISGHEGSKPREVLLSREEFNRMYMQ